MKSVLIFNYTILTFVSLYLFFLHLRKKQRNSTDVLFICMIILSLAEFILIIGVNLQPVLHDIPAVSAGIFTIPAAFFILMTSISLLFPAEKISRFRFLILLLLLLVLADAVFIISVRIPGIISMETAPEVLKTKVYIIQSCIILLSMISAPIPLIFKMRYTSYRRIRTTIIYYLSGLFISYILFIAIYLTGRGLLNVAAISNPFIPLPVLMLLVFTSHLIFNLKNNDFQKFYKLMSIYTLAFILFFVPVYFFLRYYDLFINLHYGDVYLKSGIIFVYLVISYRIINPYIEKYRTDRLQILLHAINKTLMPVNELKKFSDMDTFWEYITNDNFQNLKYTLGIQSAYFMLLNRKENVFQYTYGYGPDLAFQSLNAKSDLAEYITSYEGVFEKSYLITSTSVKQVKPEILEFFNNNGIEISMVFKNMSDNITGILFLGKIEGDRSYTSDHLAALEIFRIKIQNLLITGLILDEVTAEQVAEHDRIVVTTVKKRIIPDELASIPGIRISSFNINNSQYGGDYFDSVKISSDRTALFIADTSYSGIDSALTGMELFSILHSRTLVFNSPEKILNTMNQVLKTSKMSGSLARCSCLIIASDGNFSFANAAHNQLMIYEPDKGSFTEIETDGIPLGMEMAHRYSFTTGKLKEGAIGILYSDGLFSSCNENGDMFTQNILKDKIIKYSRETPSVIARELYSAYNSFIGAGDQLNDVTVIVFKKVKNESE